jgi:hypothetical protein
MESNMNREGYFEFHRQICQEALTLSIKKNHDYSGGEDGSNPFQNFQFVESMGMNVTTEQGFMVRLADKMKRLSGFCKTGVFQVEDESFRDTVIDVINYTCLLGAYVESKDKE